VSLLSRATQPTNGMTAIVAPPDVSLTRA